MTRKVGSNDCRDAAPSSIAHDCNQHRRSLTLGKKSMTDPIRHELISFETRAEAETFKLVLEHTFATFAFTEVEIEKNEVYAVIVHTRRLHLPKRVIAFVIGWASATTHHLQSDEAKVLVERNTEYDLYLYR